MAQSCIHSFILLLIFMEHLLCSTSILWDGTTTRTPYDHCDPEISACVEEILDEYDTKNLVSTIQNLNYSIKEEIEVLTRNITIISKIISQLQRNMNITQNRDINDGHYHAINLDSAFIIQSVIISGIFCVFCTCGCGMYLIYKKMNTTSNNNNTQQDNIEEKSDDDVAQNDTESEENPLVDHTEENHGGTQ